MYKLNMDEIDPSGVIAEHHAAVEGDTRMGFLKKAGIGGATALSGGAVLSALAPSPASAAARPPAKFGKGDIGILNFALTLEYLESAFYNLATANNIVTDPNSQLGVFLKTVTLDEKKHVMFLKGALGSHAVKKPKFQFGDAVTDVTKFAKLAQVLENTGVHAYLGQAPNLRSKGNLKAAGSILTIEARHAAVIGIINKNSSFGITPNGPFDTPFSAAKVLAAAGKFIVK